MPTQLNVLLPGDRIRTKDITIELDGEKYKLPISYRPNALHAADDPDLPTGEVDEEELTEAQRLAFARRMCALIVEWDLEGPVYAPVSDNSGAVQQVETLPAGPIALDPLSVSKVPFSMLTAINNAIIQSEVGNPTRRTKHR